MARVASLLRPAKVRSALHRRRFEWTLERTPLTGGHDIVQLGSDYGGWMLPEGIVRPGWTCYCVGAGGDISFDLELIRRYGARVRSFDPGAEFAQRAIEQAAGDDRFSIHQVAVAASDAPVRVGYTHDPQSRSVSAAGLYESSEFTNVPGRSITSLMAELGDDHIDLLKLDVEGSEYELLPGLDLVALGVKVFSVQIHHNGSVRQARDLIAHLQSAGFEPVGCKPAVKITFLRTPES